VADVPEQGRIVAIETLDQQGRNRKRRPVVIVSENCDIKRGEPFFGIAITGTFPTPPPADHVLLPYDPVNQAVTRLKKKSAAVCTWEVEIHDSNIEQYLGIVPPKLLDQILDLIDAQGRASDTASSQK
jgi:hypothetical protein